MPVVVKPVSLADFDQIASQAYFSGGDLIAPLVDYTWHVEPNLASSDADALKRTAWSAQQQKNIFLHDPSARFVKAVDTDNNDDILALARWHFYAKGWPNAPTDIELEHNGLGAGDDSWPVGLNVEMHKYMLDPILYGRKEWCVDGPQWVLTTLKTRTGHRKKGAGGLLVTWGAEQAKKDGVPAYIEASPDGVPVYKRCGFKVVGEHLCDLNPIGIPSSVVIKRMAAGSDLPAIE